MYFPVEIVSVLGVLLIFGVGYFMETVIQNPPNTWWGGVSLETLKVKPQEMCWGEKTPILTRCLDVYTVISSTYQPEKLTELAGKPTIWRCTLSPIIMVQWEVTLHERKLFLEIHPFHWTMIMGGRVCPIENWIFSNVFGCLLGCVKGS